VKRAFLSSAILLAVAALGGCSTSPTASFYTLGTTDVTVDASAGRPISVIVAPVTVPDLVDRPQFVIRVSDNQVKLDEFARWADPLKSQIPRVIVADLGQYLPSAQVSVYPQAGDPAAVYRVRVDVQRFDATLADAVMVDTLWSVSPPGKSSPLTGRTIVREPCTGAGYDAVVAAYSRALTTVSRDIAGAVRSTTGP
jgi:uncharacterized protein